MPSEEAAISCSTSTIRVYPALSLRPHRGDARHPGHRPPPASASIRPLLLPPPSSSSSSLLRSSAPTPWSISAFRGKPVGRKRRPVKSVYTSNGVEEESAEVFPGEMRRRELASELLAAAEEEEKAQEVMEEEQQLLGGVQEKKDGSYKMKHFRWSDPPASKRYGGFMKSWDERSQRPLLSRSSKTSSTKTESGRERWREETSEEEGDFLHRRLRQRSSLADKLVTNRKAPKLPSVTRP
ncbi:hypothetical protein L3Q82_000861 [Scortum barcoo]|uniref:Uncharacterized protein n=1 Tax=Scortum barcoo TaxID=214431 RepID=A0ACB8WDI2_9TELE|nr:hypothetical protein L3Q82_000861 [Scortum barcoo]